MRKSVKHNLQRHRQKAAKRVHQQHVDLLGHLVHHAK
jgi:hypothetical protein